ncbi:MAG TPA: RNA polymerase factor sigma-32 [Polyangia bacterium]|nr:RNA polymerase factor sigma-32 [Polyangia bacterium]
MRIVTAYLMDGRGQSADGRRSTKPPEPVVLDDRHDAVETDAEAEPVLDAEWTEVVEEPKPAASSDPYAAYMASLRHVERLDRDEEHTLAVEYLRTHDPKIAKRLITSNLKLVVKLAHEYTRAGKNLLDLIQEGNVGLVQAVEKYDPHRNVKLSSYAAWWIRAYILRYILQNARIVRLGTTATQRKLFFNLRKEKAKLEKMGFVPTTARVAKAMQVPEHEVIDMEQRLGAPDASLDAPVSSYGREDNDRSRMDLIESVGVRPDTIREETEFRERLHEVLMAFGLRLKGRDRELFDQRLMTDEPKTLQELGDAFGISRERTRQLEMRLMARLKTYLRAALGDAVDLEAQDSAA